MKKYLKILLALSIINITFAVIVLDFTWLQAGFLALVLALSYVFHIKEKVPKDVIDTVNKMKNNQK